MFSYSLLALTFASSAMLTHSQTHYCPKTLYERWNPTVFPRYACKKGPDGKCPMWWHSQRKDFVVLTTHTDKLCRFTGEANSAVYKEIIHHLPVAQNLVGAPCPDHDFEVFPLIVGGCVKTKDVCPGASLAKANKVLAWEQGKTCYYYKNYTSASGTTWNIAADHRS
jgi:hypothetical protein